MIIFFRITGHQSKEDKVEREDHKEDQDGIKTRVLTNMIGTQVLLTSFCVTKTGGNRRWGSALAAAVKW